MTREEAAARLGVDPDAPTGAIRRRFQEQYSDLQVRLTNAPTAALRDTYEANLRELRDACQVLSPGYDEMHDLDLPAVQPIAQGFVPPSPAPQAGPAPVTVPRRQPWFVPALVISGILVLFFLGRALISTAMPDRSATASTTPHRDVQMASATPDDPSQAATKPRRTRARSTTSESRRESTEPRSTTETRTVMEPVTTYVTETVAEHPAGDPETYTERMHDFDLLHDPPSPIEDGVMHPGNECGRVQCTHFGRCPHGQLNRCMVCGNGPFPQHSYDVYPCQHARPCQHQIPCTHTRTLTRMVPCHHMVTRQRPVTEMRPVEHTFQVTR